MVSAIKRAVNETLKISFGFLLLYLFVLMATNSQTRAESIDYEKLNLSQTGCYSKITKEEMELLLKDINPAVIKQLAEDAGLKSKQIENLRELLAIACQAVKEGFTKDSAVSQELKNIETETTAVNYDREINKDKGQTPPFAFISGEQIKAFWEGGEHEAEFNNFLDAKIEVMKANNPEMKDREISLEEKTQAKDFFAKVQIYKKEYEDKLAKGELSNELQNKVNLQAKLQTARFLSNFYWGKVFNEKTNVTEAEIQSYIAAHSEYDVRAQKAKAYKILQRLETGENFAKLAKEFSEDPGSKDKGGLYQKVTTGQFIPEFEQAALSLKVGQIYPNIVETMFGFHIIKLEGKRRAKNAKGELVWSYDARHILISVGVKDENSPTGRLIPIKEYVKSKIEKEKQKKVIDEILQNNPVVIAEDFEIPKVSGV